MSSIRLKKKVHAQRKFAQGSFAPVTNSTPINTEKRLELPPSKDVNSNKEGKIYLNNYSAQTLLDHVAFHRLHSHSEAYPVVVLERLSDFKEEKLLRSDLYLRSQARSQKNTLTQDQNDEDDDTPLEFIRSKMPKRKRSDIPVAPLVTSPKRMRLNEAEREDSVKESGLAPRAYAFKKRNSSVKTNSKVTKKGPENKVRAKREKTRVSRRISSASSKPVAKFQLKFIRPPHTRSLNKRTVSAKISSQDPPQLLQTTAKENGRPPITKKPAKAVPNNGVQSTASSGANQMSAASHEEPQPSTSFEPEPHCSYNYPKQKRRSLLMNKTHQPIKRSKRKIINNQNKVTEPTEEPSAKGTRRSRIVKENEVSPKTTLKKRNTSNQNNHHAVSHNKAGSKGKTKCSKPAVEIELKQDLPQIATISTSSQTDVDFVTPAVLPQAEIQSSSSQPVAAAVTPSNALPHTETSTPRVSLEYQEPIQMKEDLLSTPRMSSEVQEPTQLTEALLVELVPKRPSRMGEHQNPTQLTEAILDKLVPERPPRVSLEYQEPIQMKEDLLSNPSLDLGVDIIPYDGLPYAETKTPRMSSEDQEPTQLTEALLVELVPKRPSRMGEHQNPTLLTEAILEKLVPEKRSSSQPGVAAAVTPSNALPHTETSTSEMRLIFDDSTPGTPGPETDKADNTLIETNISGTTFQISLHEHSRSKVESWLTKSKRIANKTNAKRKSSRNLNLVKKSGGKRAQKKNENSTFKQPAPVTAQNVEERHVEVVRTPSPPQFSDIISEMCPSERYTSVQDIIAASPNEISERCKKCTFCNRFDQVRNTMSKQKQRASNVYDFSISRSEEENVVRPQFRSGGADRNASRPLERQSRSLYVSEHNNPPGPSRVMPGTQPKLENTPTPQKILKAPVFYPTESEFTDPIEYFERIMPIASKHGICKVVAPKSFKPSCSLTFDHQFGVTNQYISRLYSRWGVGSREMSAIKAYLASQGVTFTRPPLFEGMEVNLPKLYHVVQKNGGLKNVIEKNKWGKVAEEMRLNCGPNPDKKLDKVYVKYLLPYGTLSDRERHQMTGTVEKGWNNKNRKLIDRAFNPLHRQKKLLGESESSSDEAEDDELSAQALIEAEDCIVTGRQMNLASFKKVAATTLSAHFPGGTPTTEQVEQEYWRLVLLALDHVCVNAASIDTGVEGYGFTKNKDDPYGKHPWNLKVVSSNSGNVLRALGPVLGVTVPTLHVGMLYSTSCWQSDPQGLPWLEYHHCGAPKIWYGIPEMESDTFRRAMENLCPSFCQNKSIWLPSDIVMIPPNILSENMVSLSRVEQKPGEYIIVCPKAYSSSISTGFCVSESVYFAPTSWLCRVHQVFQEVRDSCEPTMFSLEQLLFALVREPKTPLSVLHQMFSNVRDIVHQELNIRAELQQTNIKVEARNHNTKRRPLAWNVRDLGECEICRTTLYLSSVIGIIHKKSTLCLLHAKRLLSLKRYSKMKRNALVLAIFVSDESLKEILDLLESKLTGGPQTVH